METDNLQFYRNPDQEGSVFAVRPGTKELRDDGLVKGYASTFDRPDSPVDWIPIDPAALGARLTEEEARELHPRLFERIGEDTS